MASEYTAQVPSASTDGKPQLVTGSYALWHTATSDGDELDEVYMWANNSSAVPVLLSVAVDLGASEPADLITQVEVPPSGAGAVLVVPGLRLANTETVHVKAATNGVITVWGNINNIDTAA